MAIVQECRLVWQISPHASFDVAHELLIRRLVVLLTEHPADSVLKAVPDSSRHRYAEPFVVAVMNVDVGSSRPRLCLDSERVEATLVLVYNRVTLGLKVAEEYSLLFALFLKMHLIGKISAVHLLSFFECNVTASVEFSEKLWAERFVVDLMDDHYPLFQAERGPLLQRLLVHEHSLQAGRDF